MDIGRTLDKWTGRRKIDSHTDRHTDRRADDRRGGRRSEVDEETGGAGNGRPRSLHSTCIGGGRGGDEWRDIVAEISSDDKKSGGGAGTKRN